MAYIPSECTRTQYDNTVYGIGPEHKLYIKVGNTELVEPDDFCESLVWRNQILSNGSKTFSLDNFVSKEIDLILRDYQIEDVNSELDIKLGTYIEELSDYVYIPLGKYLIQDSPVTDKGKTTYKLRDRSVLFDFNYNAKPLIDESTHETTEGSKYVTKLEILQDICNQAGVDYVGSTTFIGHDDILGIYNNTISGRLYISYIAEQAGCIAYIDRNGNLNFLLINNNLPTHQIPFDLVENYTLGNTYKVSKTIYESGELYWEKGTDDKDNLFINGANPYIANQEQVDRVHDSIVDFKIQGFSTGKIVGNPAIDSFDIIEVYDDEKDETYRTLGQNTFTYNGIFRQKFDTTIEHDAKQINTTVNNEATYRKYVKSEIDNVNATITTNIGQIDENSERIYKVESTVDGVTTKIEEIDEIKERTTTIEEDIDGLTIGLSSIGGTNLIKNSVGHYQGDWENLHTGFTNTEIKNNTVSKNCFFVGNKSSKQIIQTQNGTYTVSFKYKKLLELAEVKIIINDYEIELTDLSWKSGSYTFEVLSNTITVEIIGNNDNSCYLSDLMCNQGIVPHVWSSASGESINGGVKIGSSIEIESSVSNIKQIMDNDGNRIKNISTNETVAEYTDKGLSSKEVKTEKAEIARIVIQNVGNQTWISRI